MDKTPQAQAQPSADREPVAYMDLPGDLRIALLKTVAILGGEVKTYATKEVCIALPADIEKQVKITRWFRAWDIFPSGPGAYFPICGDTPPETMRHKPHFQNQADPPSYWLFQYYEPGPLWHYHEEAFEDFTIVSVVHDFGFETILQAVPATSTRRHLLPEVKT